MGALATAISCARRVAALFFALMSAGAVAADPAIVVGASLAQSGMLADLSGDYRKALLLWQDEVNEAGGLLGRRVELRLVDDRSEALAAGRIYERLIREDKADLLLGPFGVAASLGAAAAAERARRVLINATGAARILHKPGTRYVFQVPAPYTDYGDGLLHIARAAGLRTLFVVARDDPASREMASGLRDAARALNMSVAEPAFFASGQSDFAPLVAQAQQAGADAWVAFGGARSAAEMVKSFKRLGYAPALFVAQGAEEPRFERLVGQDAEAVIGLSPYEPRFATPGNPAFAQAFATKWSTAPSLTAAQGYAAAKVLERAVRTAATLDQEKLRAALAALETQTPLGAHRIDPQTGVQRGARVAVVQIQGGRREIVWPPELAGATWRLPYPRWEARTLLGSKDK